MNDDLASRRPTARLFCSVTIALAACSPPVPAEVHYRIEFAGGALSGRAVTLDGADVAVVSPEGVVDFTVPAAIRPNAMHLSITMPTQCGPRPAPIELYDTENASLDATIATEMARAGFVSLRGGPTSGTMRVVSVFVDRDEGDTRPVRVGEATLPANAARTELLVADCGPSAPVRVGDETIGTWFASAPATLVSATTSGHQLTSIGYGSAVTSAPVVFGQRVRSFDAVPDYLLERAPSTLRDVGTATYVIEVVRTACPTGPSYAEMAVRAPHCMVAVPWLTRAVDFDQDDVASALHLVRCAYTEDVARTAVGPLLARHPEVHDEVVAAMMERGFSTASL